jgi:hypothetical protein
MCQRVHFKYCGIILVFLTMALLPACQEPLLSLEESPGTPLPLTPVRHVVEQPTGSPPAPVRSRVAVAQTALAVPAQPHPTPATDAARHPRAGCAGGCPAHPVTVVAPHPPPATTAVPSDLPASPRSQRQMRRLLAVARMASAGKPLDGFCYLHVATYIDQVGYGGIPAGGFAAAIPTAYRAEAHQFADYLNQGQQAAHLGLRRLALTNPYAAPAGALVVVRAGTPGTHHPTAGDIAVAGGDGHFYNRGEMGYGGAQHFPAGNSFVLGIYEPQ